VTKVCRVKESARFDSSLCHQGVKTRNTKSVITPLIIGGISPNFFVGSSSKSTRYIIRFLGFFFPLEGVR
jgi:hypothetical protein